MGSGMGRGRPEAFRGFREKCINVVYILVLVYLKNQRLKTLVFPPGSMHDTEVCMYLKKALILIIHWIFFL